VKKEVFQPGITEYKAIFVFAAAMAAATFVFTKNFLDGALSPNQPPAFGLINKDGKIVVPKKFSRLGKMSEHLVPAYEPTAGRDYLGARCGYIDQTGKYLINPQFTNALPFSENLAAVQVQKVGTDSQPLGFVGYDYGNGDYRPGHTWGFIEHSGRFVISPQFEAAGSFNAGFAPAMVAQKWGFINGKGQIVIQPRFDQASAFSEGLAAVCIDDKYGYIDRSGTKVIAMQYDHAYPFSDGYAVVLKAHKFGIIDTSGKWVEAPVYEAFKKLSEGVTAVRSNDPSFGSGYDAASKRFDVKGAGNYIVFDHPRNYDKSLPSIAAYIDRTGAVALVPGVQTIELGDFHDGVANFVSSGIICQTGYIDKTGRVVIPAQFETGAQFHEGFAVFGHQPGNGSAEF